MATIAELKEQLVSKFGEIEALLAHDLGLGDPTKLSEPKRLSLSYEATDAIGTWQKAIERQPAPTDPKTPLQKLLREYCDIEDALMAQLDDNVPGDDKDVEL